MFFRYLPFIYLLARTLAQTAFDTCPGHCDCDLDDQVGYYRTSCIKGGLFGNLDLTNISKKTEILNITSPYHNTNSLIIGPIFWDLVKLREVHITRSGIPAIGEIAFLNPLLEVLNLRENEISIVLENDFKGCQNLTKLYLDENKIDRLTSGPFKYLANLRVLSLSNNRLTELVNRVFEKLGKLQELNLNGNNLKKLNPEAFIDIPELKILQCRKCGLVSIDNGFFQLIPQLQILEFGGNNIKHIGPNDLAELTNLKSLWLDGNKIEYVSNNVFYYQEELKKLNLARNRISMIETGSFVNLTSLIGINLSYNKLGEFNPLLFVPLSETVQSMDLSGNPLPISDVKLCVRFLRRLQHMGLADMDLSELPLGLFDFNKDLMSLTLSGNIFTHFPIGGLSPVPKLSYLDMSRNKFRGLDLKALQRIESIEVVNFGSNPWRCEKCHIHHMLVRLNSTTFLKNAICKTPYSLRGRRLGDLELDELRKCSPEDGIAGDYYIQQGNLSTIAIWLGIMLILVTICFVAALVYYTRRHARHYYTHEEKRVIEQEPICETTDLVFIENGEINFKFPLDNRISISTIEDTKKDPDVQANGT